MNQVILIRITRTFDDQLGVLVMIRANKPRSHCGGAFTYLLTSLEFLKEKGVAIPKSREDCIGMAENQKLSKESEAL